MNNTAPSLVEWVTVILSIGALFQPLFFGVIFLFIFKHFPTRREIELQEKQQEDRHKENLQKFEKLFHLIENNR